MSLPDRLSPLIEQLEQGKPVTPEQARRVALLQALDLAKLGQDFAREVMARDAELTAALREHTP